MTALQTIVVALLSQGLPISKIVLEAQIETGEPREAVIQCVQNQLRTE